MGFLSSLFGERRNDGARSNRRKASRGGKLRTLKPVRLAIEPLETRQLLSVVPHTDTIGIFNPTNVGSPAYCYYLKNANDTSNSGYANITVTESLANTYTAISGDWNGDGVDTVGMYSSSTGMFYLSNAVGNTTITTWSLSFVYGDAGAGLVPVVGDWNNDGTDTIGLYNPATSYFYLRNSNTTGYADITLQYGTANGGWTPMAGDWNGDGTDTIGLYNIAESAFHLRNTNTTGSADVSFPFGTPNCGWKPVAGDYNRDNVDTVGLYNPVTSCFYLKNTHSSGFANIEVPFGAANVGSTPIIGDWNGVPSVASDSYSLNEDTATNLSILSNDSSLLNYTLTPTVVSGPSHGSVTINGNGTATYTPNANYNGSDSFTYKVYDGFEYSNTPNATVSLTVTAVDDAPTLNVVGNRTVTKGQTLSVTDIGTFSDVDSSSFTYSINWGDSTTPSTGNATVDVPLQAGVSAQGSFDGSHVYANAGTYTVSATVTGNGGASSTRTFQVTVISPALTASGPSTVDEGESYPLTLPPPTNLSENLVSKYTVHWGDGLTNDYTVAQLSNAGRVVAHSYQNGAGNKSITVDVTATNSYVYTSLASTSVLVRAALVWDPDGTNNGVFGGAGTWTATNAWVDPYTNARYTWSTSLVGGKAVFSGTGGAVTLGSSTTVNAVSISFESDGYSISGGAINLSGTGGNITTNSGGDAIGSVITGTSGLTKSGSAALTLSGANTYTGLTSINAGTLVVANAQALGGSGAGTTVANGAALQLQGGITIVGEALTLNGTGVSGSGALQNLSGDNTYGGSITLATASRINSASGVLTLGNTGAVTGGNCGLAIGGTGNIICRCVIGSGINGLTKDGSGTLILAGNNSYGGGTTIGEGTLQVGEGGASGTLGSGTVTGSGYLIFNRDCITSTNAIAGSVYVAIAAGSTLKIGGNDASGLPNGTTGTGGTMVNGTLDLNGYSPTIGELFGTGTIASSVAGTTSTLKVLSGWFEGVIKNSVVQGGPGLVALEKTGSANGLVLTGNNTYTGGTTITTGSLQVGDGGLTGSVVGDVVNNGILIFSRSDGVPFAGDVTGTGSLMKSGAGTLTLSGDNTYGGGTTVSAGEIVVSNLSDYLSLSGDASVHAGGSYSLGLASRDPGSVTILRWEINWGDGTTTELTGNPSSAIHAYPVQPQQYTITATAFANGGITASKTHSVTILPPVFPMLTAYPSAPSTFAQSTDGSGLHAEDDSGQLSRAIGYATSQVGNNTLVAGNVTFDTMTELGFIARWDSTTGCGYVLSLDPTNLQFKLIKLTSATTSTTLMGHALSGINVDAGDTFKITFEVSGSSMTGKLYSSGGTLLDTINAVDSDYSGGYIGTWARKKGTPIEGTWSNMSLSTATAPATSGVSIDEGSAYTVTVPSVVQFAVQPWTVDWGDSSTQTIAADSVLSATHTYTGTPSQCTVVVHARLGRDGRNSSGQTWLGKEACFYTYAYAGIPTQDPTTPGTYYVIVGWRMDPPPETLPPGQGWIGRQMAIVVQRTNVYITRNITVNNVAPQVAITGNQTVPEGANYTLTLGSIVDPGNETVQSQSYTVDWGDGTRETYTNPASRQLTHAYADGLSNPVIQVEANLVADDGYYTIELTKPITVNDVAPSLTISGDANASEGASYALQLSADDPGADTIDHWSVDWGDGSDPDGDSVVGQIVAGNPSSVTHVFAAGAASRTITATATDEDGTYSANSLTIGINLAPTQLTATALSNTAMRLNWLDNSSSEDGYRIEWSEDLSFAEFATVGAGSTSYLIDTLSGNRQYHFRVRAYNAMGATSWCETTATTPANMPVAPQGLTAVALSDYQVQLNWNDIGSDETRYTIERKDFGGSDWQSIAIVDGNATTFTDGSLIEATAYTYRVYATNDYSFGPPNYSSSASVLTWLAKPTGLEATFVDGGTVDLHWQDNSHHESNYSIQQWMDGSWQSIGSVQQWMDGSWQNIGSVSGTPGADIDFSASITDRTYEPSTEYKFRVFATSGYPNYFHASALSNEAVATTSAWPKAPTGLTATMVSETQIHLAWTNHADDATGCKIERSPDGINGWTPIYNGAILTEYEDTGLTEATHYYYRVSAVKTGFENSGFSHSGAITRPAAPSNLDIDVVSGHEINLTWDNNSVNADSLRLYQKADGGDWGTPVTLTASQTSYTATGPFSSSVSSYSFKVETVYCNVPSTALEGSKNTRTWPAIPTDLTATAGSTSTINLAWTDVPNQTGYKIARRVAGGSWDWDYAILTSESANSFQDSNLDDCTYYEYRICATNDGSGESGYSDVRGATTLLAAPSSLSASVVSGHEINLSWTNTSTKTTGLLFLIEQKKDGEAWSGSPIASVTGTAYTAIGPFESSPTSYSFRVRAYYGGVLSDYSTPAGASSNAWPGTPTDLTATPISTHEISLSWPDVAGEENYVIERSLNGTSGWQTVGGTIGAGETGKTIGGLDDCTLYHFRIHAENQVGASGYSSTASARTLLAGPSGLTASVVSVDEISLSWTNNSATANVFYLRQKKDGGAWSDPISVTGATGVVNYTAAGPFDPYPATYTFEVKAYCDGLYSTPIESVPVNTWAWPATPTGLTATRVSLSQINLSWNDCSNETGYLVQWKVGDGGWQPFASFSENATGCPVNQSGIGETTYAFRIAAVNSFGTSPYSAPVTVGQTAVSIQTMQTADEYGERPGIFRVTRTGDTTFPITVHYSVSGDAASGVDYTAPSGTVVIAAGATSADISITPINDDQMEDNESLIVTVTGGTGYIVGSPSQAVSQIYDGTMDQWHLVGEGTIVDGKVVTAPSRPLDSTTQPTGNHGAYKRIRPQDTYAVAVNVDLHTFDIRGVDTFYVGISATPCKSGMNPGGQYSWGGDVRRVPQTMDTTNDPAFFAATGSADQPMYLNAYMTVSAQCAPYQCPSWGTLDPKVCNVDLDVDSKNDSGFAAPDDNLEEDRIEQDASTGKVVLADLGDLNGNGIVDSQDMGGIAGGQFVPMALRLPQNISDADPSQINVSLSYDSSMLRIWKPGKDASVARTSSDILASGASVSASSLGLSPGGSVVVLVEGLQGDSSTIPITVNAQVTGAKWSGTLSDTVSVMVLNEATLTVTNMAPLTILETPDPTADELTTTDVRQILRQLTLPKGFDVNTASLLIDSSMARGGDTYYGPDDDGNVGWIYAPNNTYGTDRPWDPYHPYGCAPDGSDGARGGASFVATFTDANGIEFLMNVTLTDNHNEEDDDPCGYEFAHVGRWVDAAVQGAGGLLLEGGGNDAQMVRGSETAVNWFVTQANGGDVVVIANDTDSQVAQSRVRTLANYFSQLGDTRPNSVDVFDFNVDLASNLLTDDAQAIVDDITKALTANGGKGLGHEFIDKLMGAEAVFFCGGDQWPYVQLLTPKTSGVPNLAAKAISDKNNAGSMTVGGTSAGLAILGEYVFTAQYLTASIPAMYSSDILDNYYTPAFNGNNGSSIASNVLGLKWMDSVLTETHFTDPTEDFAVNHDYSLADGHYIYRLGRFISFMGSVILGGQSESYGMAVDRNTALTISNGGMAKVWGANDGTHNVYFAAVDNAIVNNCTYKLSMSGVYMRWYTASDPAFNIEDAWDDDPNTTHYSVYSLSEGLLTLTDGNWASTFPNYL